VAHTTSLRLFIIVVSLTGSCTSASPSPTRDDEATVIRQALEDEFASLSQRDTLFVSSRLDARTAHEGDFAQWLDALLPSQFRHGVSRELFLRYWQANKRARTIRMPATLGGVWIEPLEAGPESALPADGGRYSVSRVGLTAAADSALVSVQFACHGLCGQMDLYLYVRRPIGWTRAWHLVAVSN